MNYAKRFLLICSISYSLMFFSEYFFMNEEPVIHFIDAFYKQPIVVAFTLLELVGWYILPTYLFLNAVSYFRAQHIWAFLLAGSLFGFAVEGVIVWQLYEALPFSILWTALGWHMLIDVWLGWYLTQYLLAKNSMGRLVLYCLVLGFCWAVWATWYGLETPLLSSQEFTVLAIFLGGGWVIANGMTAYLWRHPFQTSRKEFYIVLILTGLFFMLQILPVFIWAIFILPTLMLLTFYALSRQWQPEQVTILSSLETDSAWYQSFVLVLTPLTAILVYPYVYAVPEIGALVADLGPAFLMLSGGIVYLIALWKTAVRPKSLSTSTTTHFSSSSTG